MYGGSCKQYSAVNQIQVSYLQKYQCLCSLKEVGDIHPEDALLSTHGLQLITELWSPGGVAV